MAGHQFLGALEHKPLEHASTFPGTLPQHYGPLGSAPYDVFGRFPAPYEYNRCALHKIPRSRLWVQPAEQQ